MNNIWRRYMNFFLTQLTDEELKILVKEELGIFLEPIKQNEKNYIRYSSQLGSKRRDSLMVKTNLPKIATLLYRKQDRNYVKEMEIVADKYASILMEAASETLEIEITQKEFIKYSDEQIADLVLKYQIAKDCKVPLDLFWVQLKLVGFENIEERKEDIINLLGIEVDGKEEKDSFDMDNKEISLKKEVSQEQPIRSVKYGKVKKPTPEEKAAKNKAAIEAKEKEKQEEQRQLEDIINNKEFQQGSNEEYLTGSEVENTIIETEVKTNKKIEKTIKENRMMRYIGVINIKTNYYNFTPIGIFEEGVYYSLSEKEVDELLPNSLKHNINFYYNFWDEMQAKFMRDKFQDNQLVLLNCDVSDLVENRSSSGELNATGYKLSAVDAWNRGQISPLSGVGLYKLISSDALLDDIESKRAVRIQYDNLIEGEKVLINFGDGFYGGPFSVRYAVQNNTYFIVPQATDGKYFVSGYSNTDCEKIVIEPSMDVENWVGYNSWIFYAIRKGAVQNVQDFITDKNLLEAFKESLNKAGDLDYSNLNVDRILDEVGKSQIVGENLPENIKYQRIERIRKILSEKETLMQIYSEFSDLICDLLYRNKDSMQTEKLLSELFDKKPDLLDKMQGIKIIQNKVENKKAELEQLEEQCIEAEERAKNIIENANLNSAKQISTVDVLDDRIAEKEAELDSILEKLNVVREYEELAFKRDQLIADVNYYDNRKSHLINDTKNLECTFVEKINGYSEKMADITFDGYMSSKMLQAAADWENKNDTEELTKKVSLLNEIEAQEMPKEELVDYLVSSIQLPRPSYSKNTIINIITCAAQGFLTVFSGAPGCGKTSICNIVSKVLGLNNYDNIAKAVVGIRRYIPVSVERGWTSKRDFIGYYNPLTKAFEESNRDVFDGLRFLDIEQKKAYSKWPFFILLDEANLSPMEYYWADFMNVCDDLEDNSSINLGNDNVFRIPETLHFLATINNDHTTETLSPRLIDRAWIITLPKSSSIQNNQDIPLDQIRNVTWNEIKNVFLCNENGKKVFDRETQGIYEGLKEKLYKQELYISSRVDGAIQKYWAAASEIMEEDEYGNPPSCVALDYAVAQKILPKIIGSGDEYEAWLEEIKTFCDNKGLVYSAGIIASIISRGNKDMKYYKFFN